MGWFFRSKKPASANPEPLLWLNSQDCITLTEASSGLLVMGATGSGKSSGPGDYLLRGLLQNPNIGICWLTAKTDEYARAQRLCAEAGRLNDLIRVAPGQGWICDPLDVELRSEGGSVQSAAHLLDLLVELTSREGSGQGDEKFWRISFETHFYHSIAAVWLATGRASITEVYRLVTSAPNSLEEFSDPRWRQRSYCARCLLKAAERHCSHELDLCLEYWWSYANLSEKTRSIIYSATANLLAKFMTGPVAELVVGETNLFPEDVLAGKVVVLDVPALRYQKPGIFFQVLFKTLVQRAALRRDITPRMSYAVIHSDEAQLFVTAEDPVVQTVARQSRLISLALTQNLPMLFAQMGGTDKARQIVEAWIAGHQTIFLCANTCPTTNDFFSKMLGSSRQLFFSGNIAPQDGDLFDALLGNNSRFSSGFSEQYHPDVSPGTFTRLRKGGPPSFCVDALVFQSGRVWSNGKTHLSTFFQQRRNHA